MSEPSALFARLAPAMLLVALALAAMPTVGMGLSLSNRDATASTEMVAALDDLPDDAIVIVGFDPDIGTYAEIRPTVRAVIADLLRRGATLGFASFTPEGRALAIAELARMDRLEANPRQIVDLGFLPGAEAALVALAREVAGAGEILSAEAPDDLGKPALALVIGGIDMGPRSWVEQVAPRTEDLPLVAVAPTVLLPELQPYRATGQLAALLATPRDGATYRASVELDRLDRLAEPRTVPSPLPILVGLFVAVGVLGQAVGARLRNSLHGTRSREQA